MSLVDHNGEAEFPVSKDKVFDAMCVAIPTIKGLSVFSADKFLGRIVVKGSVSLASWGENVPIQLTEIGENRTKVLITSSPKTGVMFGGANDFGKNLKNIERILSATSQVLQGSQALSPNQQTNQTSNKYQQTNSNQIPQSPKKKLSVGKKILIGIGIFVLLGIIANIGKSKDSTVTSNSPEPTNTEAVKTKQWTEVFKFKGSGIKKSASFSLSGVKARVKYKYTADDAGLFSFYIVPEGEDIMKTGGVPDVMIQQSETSETYITQSAGNYYLHVNSAGGNWIVSVEEEK